VAARECERIAGEVKGDMLVFLPGAYEISRTVQAIQGLRALRDFVRSAAWRTAPDQQDRAVARYEQRKIIRFNETWPRTSLTIDRRDGL